MGGVFGVASKESCILDLFYGTDYHSHLGTRRGGMAVRNENGFTRFIHNIENTPFRSKFDADLPRMEGNFGIGCISDTDDQPLIINSHLGRFAIVTVGKINNLDELVKQAYSNNTHFSEVSNNSGEPGWNGVNPTELVATLIDQEDSFVAGIKRVHHSIDGSLSLLLLTDEGIYAARDRLGRTPVIIGRKEGTYCATLETCTFPNLGYTLDRELGPAEVVLMTPEGIENKSPAGDEMKICSFLWVYFGYPPSSYEGMNVEVMRNLSGAALARADNVEVDLVAGVPDSGTAHAIGYANEAHLPYQRPFIKYTPTWPRSFMPQNQAMRDLVARMKLILVNELVEGKRLLFCEDSIVRGTQLKDTVCRLYDCGAREVHMRPACPPLIHGCKFLNFSRSKSELDLAGRRAIRDLEGTDGPPPEVYSDWTSDKFHAMVDNIRKQMNLTSLKYQTIPDMVESICLPKDKLCTYCWDGQG